MQGFGVDIGGSGIKGAPVDVERGELVTERNRIETPQPATPDAVADVVARIVGDAGWTGPVGCTFPAVIKSGVAHTAANVDKSWIGTDAAALFTERTGQPTTVLNDADAAGVAEMAHGAGRSQRGVVLVLTLGTGIGSALFADGVLVPNTELGHLELDGVIAEHLAAAKVREVEDLSWKKWAKRLDAYLQEVDRLLWPDQIILGGGVSKHADKFLSHLHVRPTVVPAALHNDAGIVGAAMVGAGVGAASPA